MAPHALQDMASYGLAAVYNSGDDAAKQSMAATLVETLTAAAAPPVATPAAATSTSSAKPATDAATVRPLLAGCTRMCTMHHYSDRDLRWIT